MVCYFTPLMTGAYRLYSTRDSSFWCCVGSGFESHAKYQADIYYHTDNQLYVNLFIPSELNWNGVTIRQQTRFPEENKTIITASAKTNMKVRFPYWATYMKVNGRRVKAGADGYVSIRNVRRLTVEFGMSLREEKLPIAPQPATSTTTARQRVALMYGPIVMGGRLATVEHPFSNPRHYNDYYTFDYGRHADITLKDVHHLGGLHFQTADGISIEPFYNLQHCRYVVYWGK